MIRNVVTDSGIDWSAFAAMREVFRTYVREPLLHMVFRGGDRCKCAFEGIVAALGIATDGAQRSCYYAQWHDQAVLSLRQVTEPADLLSLFTEPAEQVGDMAALLTDNNEWLFAVEWSPERESISVVFGGTPGLCTALDGALGNA